MTDDATSHRLEAPEPAVQIFDVLDPIRSGEGFEELERASRHHSVPSAPDIPLACTRSCLASQPVGVKELSGRKAKAGDAREMFLTPLSQPATSFCGGMDPFRRHSHVVEAGSPEQPSTRQLHATQSSARSHASAQGAEPPEQFGNSAPGAGSKPARSPPGRSTPTLPRGERDTSGVQLEWPPAAAVAFMLTIPSPVGIDIGSPCVVLSQQRGAPGATAVRTHMPQVGSFLHISQQAVGVREAFVTSLISLPG